MLSNIRLINAMPLHAPTLRDMNLILKDDEVSDAWVINAYYLIVIK